MHLAICRRKTFFTCCINSYNMSQLKCFFIIACKTLKMAFEVSREVLPDTAFLLASVQMAPQLKCWQPVWGDRPFLISSFYAQHFSTWTGFLLRQQMAPPSRSQLIPVGNQNTPQIWCQQRTWKIWQLRELSKEFEIGRHGLVHSEARAPGSTWSGNNPSKNLY